LKYGFEYTEGGDGDGGDNIGDGAGGDSNGGDGGFWLMMPLTQATRKTTAIGNISGNSAMINTSF
jgi:hypothetical protein